MITNLGHKFLKVERKEVFCALCRVPRELKNTNKLSVLNYSQILLLTFTFTWLTYSFMHFKGLISIIPLWAIFEFVKKSLYRKELSCPHCGFDPTWYKRDVKMARAKVKTFLDGQKIPQGGAN